MKNLNLALARGIRVVLTFMLMILLIPVALQITSRITDIIPNYIWTEEMARFCLIWIIMLGASVGVRENIHFDVDLLPEAQTPFMHFLGQVVVQVSILAVASTFIIYGWRFTEFGLNQESELTGLNMAFIHIAWPIAGLFWVLFATERIVDAWKSLKSQGGLS